MIAASQGDGVLVMFAGLFLLVVIGGVAFGERFADLIAHRRRRREFWRRSRTERSRHWRDLP